MTKNKTYKGPERRQFVRLDYLSPLGYKVCKKSTITRLLRGYTSNVSSSGLLCNINERVKKDDILWVAFNRDTLSICKDLETRSLIYQQGIVGKVVRVERKRDNTYNVGIQFVTRQEKNLTNIYPKVYFQEKQKKTLAK